ncbi:ATP-binding protein [Corynebacterium renale]|uniref:AAA domain-containing protein n=1 Tax=Corynebacterium renale TaxID=1724 RepID=A0A2A9DMA1_9CORY|nr:ATP-binding protein [Corynebacterium renale]PFG27295.1 hypothetical protein ATK06_0350 [Corynebacterium renale]SQI23619.1 Uncharacterised protein [Corynebacterium renale]
MKDLVPRKRYLDELTTHVDADIVRIITGVRRCGKSSLLEMYRRHLLAHGATHEQIVSINFEDFANDTLRDPHTFHDYVKQRVAEGATYLHVDEVQELSEWPRVINSLRTTTDLEIIVTGSNASIFASKDATYMAGRYLQLDMFPLSLAEFRDFTGTAGSLAESYVELLKNGSLPGVVTLSDDRLTRQFNSAVFDSIFTRDITIAGDVRDTEIFLRIARYIFDNAGSPVAVSKIAGTLTSSGHKVNHGTVDRYLSLMRNAHLIYPCYRYDIRGREWLRTNPKFYWVDPGLRNALLGSSFTSNRGHDLENMVYLELLRRGWEVSTGKTATGEIDFVAQQGEDTRYIQVALHTMDDATLSREVNAFNGLPAGARCYLITTDTVPPSVEHIEHVDAFAFLAGAELK